MREQKNHRNGVWLSVFNFSAALSHFLRSTSSNTRCRWWWNVNKQQKNRSEWVFINKLSSASVSGIRNETNEILARPESLQIQLSKIVSQFSFLSQRSFPPSLLAVLSRCNAQKPKRERITKPVCVQKNDESNKVVVKLVVFCTCFLPYYLCDSVVYAMVSKRWMNGG